MADDPLTQLDERLRDRALAATAHADYRTVRPVGDGWVIDALAADRVVHMALELRADGSVAEATETFLVREVKDIREGEDCDTMVVDFADGARQGAVPLAADIVQKMSRVAPADAKDAFTGLMASLDQPMLIVTAAGPTGGRGIERAGCLVAFAAQISIRPARMIIGLSDKNRTTEVAARSSHLAVHFLGQPDLDLARLFGEETGDDVDKLARVPWKDGRGGVPLLEGTNGWAILQVKQRIPGGDHILYLVELVAAERRADEPPLRYHDVAGLDPGHGA